MDPKIAVLAINAVRSALNRKGDVSLEMAKNTMSFVGRKDVSPQQLYETYTPTLQ